MMSKQVKVTYEVYVDISRVANEAEAVADIEYYITNVHTLAFYPLAGSVSQVVRKVETVYLGQ